LGYFDPAFETWEENNEILQAIYEDDPSSFEEVLAFICGKYFYSGYLSTWWDFSNIGRVTDGYDSLIDITEPNVLNKHIQLINFENNDAFKEFCDDIPENRFRAMFTGYLKIDQNCTYYFQSYNDDGFRLFIGDESIIDDWEIQSPNYGVITPVDLEVGIYPIKVEYWDWDFGIALKFKYSKTSG